MTSEELKQLFSDMNRLHVVVVGDVMLDNYWWGQVDRISPEAPVPVVSIHRKESRAGGAANVALNCRALGAKVTLASVTGADDSGERLRQLCAEAGIDTQLLVGSKERTTTNKTRVLSRHQQMIRLDEEQTAELSTADEHPFIDKTLRMLQREKPQVLIFEDYNKGVLKENVIDRITRHCQELGIITLVDPKKHNFLAYRNVTIFKPNLKEVREGLSIALETINEKELNNVHHLLQEQLHHSATFITLSEKGVFAADGKKSYHESAHIRDIADVSGAGDTVIATAALVYALSRDLQLMASVANIAGGLVCEEIGVMPIDRNRLETECIKLLSTNKEQDGN